MIFNIVFWVNKRQKKQQPTASKNETYKKHIGIETKMTIVQIKTQNNKIKYILHGWKSNLLF